MENLEAVAGGIGGGSHNNELGVGQRGGGADADVRGRIDADGASAHASRGFGADEGLGPDIGSGGEQNERRKRETKQN